MKKHLKVILIVISILAVCGVGLWFVLSRTKIETLPNTVNSFIGSQETSDLQARLKTSQSLYSKHASSDVRLTDLENILIKIDEFEQDLNTYLIMCTAKAKETKDLTNSYNNLSTSRTKLIKDCDEFIVRLRGNTEAESQTGQTTVKTLYNTLLDKVANYLQEYNKCFLNTSNYVFNSVTSNNNIKFQLYSLYSHGVSGFLNNMETESYLLTIKKLNNSIRLDNHNNLVLKESIDGGEFNIQALNFKTHYNNSNKESLIDNFTDYLKLNINPATETSNEKLAIYYAKKILEV